MSMGTMVNGEYKEVSGGASASTLARITALENELDALKADVGFGGFRSTFMSATFGEIIDCNDLPIGYCGYTYDDTQNPPSGGGQWMILCCGVNNGYKWQIGIRFEQMAFRSCHGNNWGDWKFIQNT